MKKIYNFLLPKYVRLPLLTVLLLNCIAFNVVPILLGENAFRYNFSIPLDTQIPFVPFFIVFYFLAFPQWVFTYIGHSRLGVETCYRMVSSDLIAKLLCLLVFIFLPTQMVRPQITGNGFFEQCVAFIYWIDKPISLLPSIHCLESWICFRTAFLLPNKNAWYITAQGILTAFVCASTVLIKQHLVLDIPTGILAAEIGIQLSNRFGLWRFVDKLQTPSARKWLAQNR